MSTGNGSTTMYTTATLLTTDHTTITTTTTIPANVLPSSERLLIGVILAIIGNLLISVSMNIQKYSHNLLAETNKPYLKSPVWWCGILMMVFGEVGNFTAYAFAPATLVAPLGTTTVIANAVIAVIFLKETVRYQDMLGITLSIVGAFLLINFSKKSDHILDANSIMEYGQHWVFLFYMVLELAVFALLVYLNRRFQSVKVVVILLQVAILGSFTVISAKAVSSMLTLTLKGDSQLKYPIFYLMLAVMVISAIGQVRFLNEAMAQHDTTVVVPTNFVLFTVSAILGGVIFYQEFFGLTFLEIFMFLFGASLSFIGVYFITGDRNKSDASPPSAEERQELLSATPLDPGITSSLLYNTTSNLKRVQPEDTTDNTYRMDSETIKSEPGTSIQAVD